MVFLKRPYRQAFSQRRTCSLVSAGMRRSSPVSPNIPHQVARAPTITSMDLGTSRAAPMFIDLECSYGSLADGLEGVRNRGRKFPRPAEILQSECSVADSLDQLGCHLQRELSICCIHCVKQHDEVVRALAGSHSQHRVVLLIIETAVVLRGAPPKQRSTGSSSALAIISRVSSAGTVSPSFSREK